MLRIAVVLTIVFGATQLATAQSLKIATDGQSPYVIVTPDSPTAEEATAAAWLAETLKKVTGAELPVRTESGSDLPANLLLVGNTNAARMMGVDTSSLKPEAWQLKSVGSMLILNGGRPRGTIYAVCEFLENEIGVLMLDPFTEFVPSKPTIEIRSINRKGQPAFPVRALFTGFPYGYPANGGLLTEKYRVWNKNTISGRVQTGDHPRMVPSGVHTFGNFIPPKEFAASHPEYFGMDASGKRPTDDMGSPGAWTQICPTNEDVRRLTLERARLFLRDEYAAATNEKRSPAIYLSLSQNDNTSNLCLCPQCQAVTNREGSESGPLLEYVNFVARNIKDEFPNVMVQTEAYNFTIKAPRTIVPESNVVVRYCDNYGFSDFTHPLSQPRNERSHQLFDQWRQKQCKLGVWDYWRTFQQHPPGFFAPSSNVRAMKSDLKLFQESGVELMTIEVEDFLGAGINDGFTSADLQSFMPLRIWLGMKLLDTPDRNLSSLIEQFCSAYYGSAASMMRALLERIEARQAELVMRVVDVQRHVWAEQMCDADFMLDAMRWLDQAMDLTQGNKAIQSRIRRERLVIDSTFLWLEQHLRQQTTSRKNTFPRREDVLARHRVDWQDYLATVFDSDGQKLAMPIIKSGVALAEKLRLDDSRYLTQAVAITEAKVNLDGQLSEPFWQQAEVHSLLSRDSSQPNDDATLIRYAWTSRALYVAIEQPTEKAFATIGVSLMAADRKGIQAGLYVSKANGNQPVNGYFYSYEVDGGLKAETGRKSQSQSFGSISDSKVVTEMRFLWTDISESPDSKADFVINVEAYPTPESKIPSHVSSPWLVGTQPNWHSGYFGALHLKPADPRN